MRSAGKSDAMTVQQVGAVNRDVRRTVELFAERIERRALQGAPVLPASLVGEKRADALAVEPGSEAQSAQDAHRVRTHVDAATDLGKLGRLLIDVDLEAGLAQRQRGGEATDAATNNGDPERYDSPLRAIDTFAHRDLRLAAQLGALYAARVNR